MLSDAHGFKHVYIAVGHTDLRKGIDGLTVIIREGFGKDPYDDGSIFLFCGRRTDRIKALTYADGDGMILLYKRLSGEGRFQWPRNGDEAREITEDQFRWLMQGLSVDQKKAIQKGKPTIT